MARIELSGLISDMRGKFGGSVFQRGQGGLIVRSNTKGIDKKSASQESRRIIDYNVLQAWSSLTEIQRTMWNSYAVGFPILQKNSKSLTLNGQQIFYKFNISRQLYGLCCIDEPVFSQTALVNYDINIVWFGGEIFLQTDRQVVKTTEYIIVQMSYPVLQSNKSVGSRLRSLVFATENGTLQEINTPYLNVFGQIPAVGDFVFVRFSTGDLITGQLLPFQTYQKEVISL